MRRNRKRSGFQRLRKFLRKLLIRLGLIRSRPPLPSSPSPTDVKPTVIHAKDVQPIVRQEVQTVDRGSIVVNSIANVTGNVCIGCRPRPGIPFQVPPLPTYYVDRRDIRERLKLDLLGTNAARVGTLVVSAVYGLGGIGKSVLAAAIAGEREVQEKFSDGVLWVTLGQEPQVLEELGNWIQAVGDRDYKPMTIDGASRHLRSLLFEKRMLLVVDDVWNWSDGEPFQVGGMGCRVLVTTREAHIPGTVKIDLEVMNDDESIELLERYLKRTLTGDDRRFALELKSEVAGLPLALELAAAQIADGLDWDDLLRAFREEVARLEILDAPDFDPSQQEKARKKRSLGASFNLSLKRLTDENLKRFVMMGVLPEDVSVGSEAMATLWDVTIDMAEKTLRELRRRSLLLDGVKRGEAKTYRMHDLVHDTAMNLMLETLGLGIDEAHNLVLSRYRTTAHTWFSLQNDGYIHSHLTRHLEKARREVEIHELMMTDDEKGRNAWFETCDRLGQPEIFVQDIARAWHLAEKLHPYDSCQSIVLQCRYALIIGTLNSLVGNFSYELFSGIAQYGIWDEKRIINFIENLELSQDKARYICAVIPYMSDSKVIQLGQMVESLPQSDKKAECLVCLSMREQNRLQEAYCAVEEVKDNFQQAMLFIKLISISENDIAPFKIILKKIDNISDTYHKAIALTEVIQYKHDEKLLNRILLLANSLTKDDFPTLAEPEKQIRIGQKAFIHSKLIKHRPDLLKSVMNIVDSTSLKADKAHLLINLTKYYSTDFLDKALEAISQVNETSSQAELMIFLKDFGENIVNAALTLQNQINDTYNQLFFILLFSSSEVDVLKIAASITDSYQKARSFLYIKDKYPHVLIETANFKDGIEEEHVKSNLILEIASKIQIQSEKDKLFEESFILATNSKWEHRKSLILQNLIQQEISDDLLERIKLLVGTIQDPLEKSKALAILAKYDSNLIVEIDDLIDLNISEYGFKGYFDIGYTSPHDDSSFIYSKFLIYLSLINHFPEYLFKAYEMLERIKNVSYHAMGLCNLVPYKPDLYACALEEAQNIGADFAKADVLGRLISISPQHMISKTMIVIDSIVDPFYRAEAYSQIIKEYDLEDCSYADWCELIRLLANRKRADLMGDLATLYPAILHLGGEDAGRRMVREMTRVCRQWK